MIGVPKPRQATDTEKQTDRIAKLRARQAKWRAIAIQKSKGKARKPLPKVNRKAQARRNATYAKHIGSAYWLAIRLAAYKRDGGLCQCPTCIQHRKNDGDPMDTRIDVWFDRKGGIHGFDTHHTSYARFGAELLSDVLTMTPAHHRKLEALTGKRRAFLRGSHV